VPERCVETTGYLLTGKKGNTRENRKTRKMPNRGEKGGSIHQEKPFLLPREKQGLRESFRGRGGAIKKSEGKKNFNRVKGRKGQSPRGESFTWATLKRRPSIRKKTFKEST